MSNRGRAVTDLLQFGLHHQSNGRLAEAEAAYRKALVLSPRHPDTLHLLGMAAFQRGQDVAALDLIGRAIAEKPQIAMYHYNRGNVLSELGRLDDAIDSYLSARARNPDFPDLHTGLGLALRAALRLPEAEDSLREAVRRSPGDASLHSNLASLLSDRGKLDDAEAALHEAMRLAPDNPEYAYNLGMTHMMAGRLAEGFAGYEHRWQVPPMTPRDFTQPLWQGEPLLGRTLLVHAEQGLGDTLQFCRYLESFDPADRILLEVQRPLVRLMTSLSHAVAVIPAGDPLPAFDLHCPLMTLPAAFGITLTTIPAIVPYLHAATSDVATWRARLDGVPGLRIGLVWAGRPDGPEAMLKRSMRFAQIEGLLDVEGATFVSLQKGEAAERELKASARGRLVLDWTPDLGDFADTAALVEALDMVIGIDTSVVHLAGALGKPVWLMNRFNTCWRWLREREDSPWYPTLRQFRQTEPGDWDAVLGQVRQALIERVAQA